MALAMHKLLPPSMNGRNVLAKQLCRYLLTRNRCSVHLGLVLMVSIFEITSFLGTGPGEPKDRVRRFLRTPYPMIVFLSCARFVEEIS